MWNSGQEECEQAMLSQQTTQLLRLLTTYSEPGELPLVELYNVDYLLSQLDRNRICSIERNYRPYDETGMDIVDFLRLMLSTIEHADNHTFYLSIAAVELFREVASFSGSNDKIRFEQLTDFICRRVLDEKVGDFSNKKKLVSIRNRVELGNRICEVNASPPIIHGNLEENILKLGRNVVVRDRSKHTGQVKKGFYAASLNRLLALDGRADYINVYDLECRLESKIVPAVSVLKRDIVVLSFAYSKRQERLGAVLENFSMSFWDLCEGKPFEKNFTTVEQCQECQQQIWFLQYQSLWVTADNSGMLNSWELDLEKIEYQLRLKNSGLIAALCELPSMNLIALAQQGHYRDLDKSKRRKDLQQTVICVYSLQRNQLIVEIEVQGSRGGLHTLWFSTEYQVLLAAGYESTMSVFQIDPNYFDATLKGKLIGHESLIVTFVAIDETPMVVSCDDRQKLKVWDLRSYKCLQTVDFSGRAAIRGLVSLVDVGKIALLGNRIELLTLDCDGGRNKHLKTTSPVCAMRVDFEPLQHELIVFTKDDLRLYDVRTGRIKHIFTGYLQSEEEPSAYRYIHDGRIFAVGSSQGELRLYSKETGMLVAQLEPHEGDISSIVYDATNRMFISAGWDSNILIQKQNKGKPVAYERIRSIRDNFDKKEVNLMELSLYHSLIAAGCSRDGNVLIWDYTTAKLLAMVNLPHSIEPTALGFINGAGILLVADTTPRLLLLKFERKLNKLKIGVWMCIPFKKLVINHLLVDIRTNQKQLRTTIEQCSVYLAHTTGRVSEVDLPEISKLPVEPLPKNNSYSAERQINQSFINERNKQFYSTVQVDKECLLKGSHSIKEFQAHRQQLTCLSFMEYTKKYLLTASSDGHLKIWINRELICDTNLNMPLPYRWQLQPDLEVQQREKMLLTLKVIEKMLRKYSGEITINECSGMRVDQFFKELSEKATFVTEAAEAERQSPKVALLQEEFTRKDLNYDKIRKYYFREVAGPSLKEMEVKGRMRSIQRMLNQQSGLGRCSEVDEDKFAKANRQNERKQLLDFLSTQDNNDKEIENQFQRYTEARVDQPQGEQEGATERQSLSKCKTAVCRIRPKRLHRTLKQFQNYYEDRNKENIPAGKPKPKTVSLSTTGAALVRKTVEARPTVAPLTSRQRKKKFAWVLNQLNQKAFRARNSPKYDGFQERLAPVVRDSFPGKIQLETEEFNCLPSSRNQAHTGRL